MISTIATPGIYINEIDAFPNSVVPVATAVPAFIGYTPQAQYQGKSYFDVPQKVSSFAEFQAIYMLPDAPPPLAPARQYSPQYYLVAQNNTPACGDYLSVNGQYFSVLPDPATIYFLYNSVRLFYQNGGGDAYIVAVGGYGAPSKTPLTDPCAQAVNPNVVLADLQRGLALLKNAAEPTMYICPEATLLSPTDNATLMQAMLQQAAEMQTAVCLFDIIGGGNPDPVAYTGDIQNFRDSTGKTGLNYGIAYYPFVGTSIMQAGELDFTNLFGGDTRQLAPLLNPPAAPNPAAASILGMIDNPPPSPMSDSQLQAALLAASPVYAQIFAQVLATSNLLPPSGGMAGVFTANDNASGVWSAPANIPIAGAASLPILLTDSDQANLNIDPVSGKSVNAIRLFTGRGILVWGARTLDGNSQDWRYISVRRTMIYLEQSIKLAARAYVFQPNDANTWSAVKSMIENFLTQVWQEGGLQGSTPASAFNVSIGLGTTMTADDILNGYMNVSVQVAVTHPAEYLVITFQQQQADSA